MTNNPDTFGITFSVLAVIESEYVYNMTPYIGAYEHGYSNERQLAEDVLKLMRNLSNKGYNMTADNCFTSPNLAAMLSHRGTTLVGTVRLYRTGIPHDIKKEPLNQYENVRTELVTYPVSGV